MSITTIERLRHYFDTLIKDNTTDFKKMKERKNLGSFFYFKSFLLQIGHVKHANYLPWYSREEKALFDDRK